MSKNIFEILREMRSHDIKHDTRFIVVSSHFISADKVSQGAKIAMGTDKESLYSIMNGKVIPLLILIDKEENTVATMESKETNWNDLTLKERFALVNHNEQLDLYSVGGNYFAVNAFVRCKNNGIIRYITKQNGVVFEDNGKVSGCEPSPSCHYEYYVMI